MDVALQSSVWVTSPEFAGYLQKRGFHVSFVCLLIFVTNITLIFSFCNDILKWRKLWKQRWVALHGAEIVYMDKEPTSDNAADMAITKAPVRNDRKLVD